MTTQRSDQQTTTDSARGSNGLLLDPEAARREARRGWVMLTGIFVFGGILVALAALLT
jgi:hypothetical protein